MISKLTIILVLACVVPAIIIGCGPTGSESQVTGIDEDRNKTGGNHTEVRSDAKKKTSMSETTQKRKMPDLQAVIRAEDNKLTVSYTVKNTTDEAIYLFNVLWDMDNTGNYVSAPQPLYAALKDDGTLLLAKKILPLPKKKIELRVIPFVTKIEAGDEFSEDLTLDLPVEEYNQYYPKTDSTEYEIRKSGSVIFTVQFIRESDELKINEAAFSDAQTVWHPDLFGNVETLESKPKPVEVTVNKRLDEFESIE